MTRRKPRPPKPDLRQPWQIEQGARCGCRGADDMCPCQNESPWPAPVVGWKSRAEALQKEVEELKANQSVIPPHVVAFAVENLRDERDALSARLAEATEIISYFESRSCPNCNGDCASANPPVTYCPMRAAVAFLAQQEQEAERG